MKSNGKKIKKKKMTIDKLVEETALDLKDKILEKFQGHCLAILKINKEDDKNTELKVIINDSDSNKLPKQELQQKIDSALKELILDNKTACEAILTSTIVQECKDGSFDKIRQLSKYERVYDSGIVEALCATWMHKELVLKKLEKYVVAYVVTGSIIKGVSNPKSDIDGYIIIDDTDVKKMNRFELQDKLRSIIHNIGTDVERELNVKRKLHTQVWLLTDYWDNLKEANPVMMTMLRDCIPIFDRGMFMAWKNLLDSGRIKPSTEAIDLYFNSGEQMYNRANQKMLEVIMEEMCLSLLYPSQAILMLAGEQPPAPKDAANKLKEIFVDKINLLDIKDVEILDRAIKMRKSIEYGEIKNISDIQIESMIIDGKNYLEKIKGAFVTFELSLKQKENTKGMSSQ